MIDLIDLSLSCRILTSTDIFEGFPFSLCQALSWAMYRMCVHPHVQEKAREEVAKAHSATPLLEPSVGIEGFHDDQKDSGRKAIDPHEDQSKRQDQTHSQGQGQCGSDGLQSIQFSALQDMKYLEAFCMEVPHHQPLRILLLLTSQPCASSQLWIARRPRCNPHRRCACTLRFPRRPSTPSMTTCSLMEPRFAKVQHSFVA